MMKTYNSVDDKSSRIQNELKMISLSSRNIQWETDAVVNFGVNPVTHTHL